MNYFKIKQLIELYSNIIKNIIDYLILKLIFIMYFLGIDPGIRKLGFAIIDKDKKIIESGAIINEDKNNIKRMYDISKFFDKIIKKYKIKGVCIEKLFFTKYNQSNAEFIYGIRGILLEKFYKNNINIIELTPKEIKKFITGNGKASKLAVQINIKRIFNLTSLPEPHDIADALAMSLWAFKKFNK